MQDLELVPGPTDDRIPLLVVGDAPTLQTGLGRIARDVTELMRRDSAAGLLPFRIAQLGLKYDGRRCNWHVYPIKDENDWGMSDVVGVWEDWIGETFGDKGVIFTFWDPGRCPAMTVALNAPGDPVTTGGLSAIQRWTIEGRAWPRLWGYFAVDAADVHGSLGGPVPETLSKYQRVLAYTTWGGEVLEKVVGRPVPSLPHGLDLQVFSPKSELPQALPEEWRKNSRPIIGVVATNTPRKDWGIVFGALEGVDCHLWVHIDSLISAAWSIPELAMQFGRNDPSKVIVTSFLDDEEMARWYSVCDATIAPGLGEGWGYPLAESLACGTPVVHINHGGGKGLIPTAEWRFAPAAQRLEGPYALIRPVVAPGEVKSALRTAASWARSEPLLVREYCRGSVAHLDWTKLWPHWRQWVREGLEGL